MSDFAQSGLICTLQRLNPAYDQQLETELTELGQTRSIALILPCHAGELERPALAHICAELQEARWLNEVVVSMNGLDAEGFRHARRFFSQLPQKVRILWNDGPRLRGLHSEIAEGSDQGKGLNVWAAIGLLTTEGRSRIIATQDCDVASFRRSNLARLCYACIHPQLGFQFAKMYYSRVTDRLYGRVSRLFFAPLLHSVLRVTGHQPMLDFLLSFRYPLAGECALNHELAATLPWSAGWALEVGALCEVFRQTDPREICQVDAGSGYDHKHQAVERGLAGMCGEIAQALFMQLTAEGVRVDEDFRAALASAFRKESALALRRSSALAQINGLPFDQETEQGIIDIFTAQLDSPSGHVLPPLPA
ncbi:MAG: glycosyl transferase, partial [Verrucomicrobiaceae bacterium]